MLFLCKDQESYDAFIAFCEARPSLPIDQSKASVITPQQMMQLFEEGDNKLPEHLMVDLRTIAQLEARERDHEAMAERMGSHNEAKMMTIQYNNHPGKESFTRRVEYIMQLAGKATSPHREVIHNFLLKKAAGTGHVNFTEEMLVEIENLVGVNGRVAIVGGGIRRGDLLFAESGTRTFIDEPAFRPECIAPKLTTESFGREQGRKSRRATVVSAKGNAYPLPKGPRGMPRVSRTRGR